MIVSDQHKYLFVQLPHTACTAVGRELVENYGGIPILHKHASINAFRRWAGSAADDYYVFATVRNPMDEVVSIYHKFKNNHKGHYSNPANWRINGGWLSRRGLRQFQFVRDHNATFVEYFKRFFLLPYVNSSVLVYGRADAILRFESIQTDFATVMNSLGVKVVRPLPVVNRTQKDSVAFEEYYDGVEERARRVFGPINDLWGYSFPPGWKQTVPTTSKLAFFLSRYGRTCFWNLNNR